MSAYDIYQHLMDYWAETMQDDCYLIAADGWVKAAQPREIVQVKDKNNKNVWPDEYQYLKGKRRFRSDLLPASLLVARYFQAEQDTIASLDDQLAMLEQQMPEQLSPSHLLVETARRQLRAATANDSRTVSTNPEESLNISVASASVTRALRIMEALIRAWEDAGGEVMTGVKDSDHHLQTAFTFGPDRALVKLEERTERIPDWKPPKDYWRRHPPHRPTGILVFTVHYWRREGLRSVWADGKRQRLEDLLDNIYEGLHLHIQDVKRHRLDNECEARQKAAAEEIRALRERYEKEDQHRSEQLAKEVDAWHQAGRIRAYLAALRQAVDAGELRVTDENTYSEWTDWARWYADHIDPMVLRKTRPGRAKPPANVSVDALEFTSFTKPVVDALGISDANALYSVTQKQVEEIEKQYSARIWSEICRVLEGLGYNMRGRQYW